MSKLSETPPENLTGNGGGPASAEFSLEQRRVLLGIAHDAILSVVGSQGSDPGERGRVRPSLEAQPSSPQLSEPRGVFTTLYLNHQLRGCVGYAVAVVPLYRAVAETACAAAFEDSRFVQVTKEEAPQLEVSLSVLSHLFAIRPEAVEVGRHGLVVSQGTRRGLLLPQVPAEHGWDRETFLEQTCRKAGLPVDAWRKGASIEAFTAEVFGDVDVAG
ncbi:MAG: AmmeMemoRadiSam system protein A [Terriglobales bacterium]